LKENSELKNELAKALFLLSMVKGSESDMIKQELLDSIRAKRSVKAMRFTGNMPAVNALLTIFSRLGLYSDSTEKRYVVQRTTIWLGKKEAGEMDSIMKELELIEPKLQWKNAQRQIKILTDEEEKEFAEIQKRYLELLNMRDALVVEYSKKEDALLALKAV
jgi:hypothetical protein